MLLVLGGSSPRALAADGDPFAYSASVGPEAASHVDAFVTRVVGGRRLTLPAAAIPALLPGDEVTVRFPDYMSPPSATRYHVDVAFITERPPVQWLFGKSGPWDGLFVPPHKRGTAAARSPEIDFTYGTGNRQGIPIFFIVPEDDKTRGMNGVRDYVDAHPTDFKDMSVSADQAVERYSWFRDFMSSLAQGAFDPDAQQRVVSIATSLGASPSAVEGCYSSGSTSSEIANCVQSQLLAVQYQTNIEAPTQAQFFGGVASATAPTQLALYLEPLLAIWQIFSRAGHTEYEYLPTTLHLLDPRTASSNSEQLLMGMKVPTLRPPGATSSALFFTIGDPAAAGHPPTLVDDDSGTGVCVSEERLRSPLHLDQTSPYVNDTALVVTDASAAAREIPVDPAKAAAPLIDRTGLVPGDGYDLRFTGRFGFDSISESARLVAHLAVPGASRWQLTQVADRAAVAGGALDVIATSPDAPCLSGAELQLGGNTPVPLKIDRLDAEHVELTGSLESVPAGVAEIRLSENDRVHGRLIAGTATVAIAGAPAGVDPKSNPTAFLGDREVLLAGHGFERIGAVRIASSLYAKTPDSRGDLACFVGPPIGGSGAAAGAVTTAELVPASGGIGEAFPLQIDAPRPAIANVAESPTAALHLSTDRLAVTLDAGQEPLPRTFAVRLRRAPVSETPCGGLRKDASASVVPAADTYRASVSEAALALRAGDVLPGNAFGVLQVQLVDSSTGVASDWVDLPGRFVRAPLVSNVACTTDANAPCTLWGTGLAAIAGVVGPDGKPIAPGLDCSPTDKLECRSVPRLVHYRLALRDAPLTIAVPDRLVAGNTPAVSGATPSPPPAGS